MARVSVVVPVYNAEPYLRTCMESIVRQTLRDLEIICVNDGSRDRSLDILKEYAERDPRVVVINQANGGYGRAMNVGLEKVSGEYAGIVEPDDYIDLTMYEDLYQCASEEKLDIVKADFYRFVTDEKNRAETYMYTALTDDGTAYETVFCPLEKPESFYYAMNTWTGIYRTAFLREHGIRHHETPGAAYQDNGFWFQTFIHAQRVKLIPRAYYRVRRDNPNSSIRDPGKVYAMNEEYDYIRQILLNEPGMWEKIKQVYWRKRVQNYEVTMTRIDAGVLPEYRARISREMKEGLDRGEYSLEAFPEAERERVDAYLNNRPIAEMPQISYLPPGEQQARAETQLIMNSASYRIGRAITLIPRKLRDLAKRAAAR